MAPVPSFDRDYPRETLPIAFTPENLGRRPTRKEYPYDPAVVCLVLIPKRLYVVEKTVLPGLQGLPFAISDANTRVWRQAEFRGDAFRVNLFRGGILSVDAAPYGKAVAAAKAKFTEDFERARRIIESDEPDLIAYDALTMRLADVIIEPYRSKADVLSEAVGQIAALLRAGGRKRKADAEAVRVRARTILDELHGL